MSSSVLIHRANRWLAISSLVAFSALGLFGHALHALLPCGDGACADHVAAEHDGCHCCSHCHAAAPQAAASDREDAGAQVRAAEHDAASCALCTLLAKMKVGRPALMHAGVIAERHEMAVTGGTSLLSHDLALSGSPRGPPRA